MLHFNCKKPVAMSPGKVLTPTQTFASAGLGGVLGWIIVHPFNTAAVKMSLASMSGNTEAKSFFPFLNSVIKKEGAMSLYDGLSAGVMRQIFYATSRFGLFETFRDMYKAKFGSIDFMGRLVCGVTSGGVAACISCPAEVTLVRLSNDGSLPASEQRGYKGVGDAFLRIFKEEGPKAFFRGAGPFVNRAMMVGAVQVGTYDQFKASYKKMGITHEVQNVFCAAMTSGLLYALVTMPLETCKNRMAFQKADPKTGKFPFTSTTQALTKIAGEQGVLSLWTGFLPYYIRCGGHTVTMFMFIQQIRSFM
jgi:solute carrier family 25 oxoglutarate transporter 11